jgi:hypothetical protein
MASQERLVTVLLLRLSEALAHRQPAKQVVTGSVPAIAIARVQTSMAAAG